MPTSSTETLLQAHAVATLMEQRSSYAELKRYFVFQATAPVLGVYLAVRPASVHLTTLTVVVVTRRDLSVREQLVAAIQIVDALKLRSSKGTRETRQSSDRVD